MGTSMQRTFATLTGIAGAALLMALLSACGADVEAQPIEHQPLIVAGGSVLHVERHPRPHLGGPTAIGAGHANGEPLAGLMLFLAMRLTDPAARLAAGAPCPSSRASALEHPHPSHVAGARRHDGTACAYPG